ncbi:MAG TPA: septum formation protein Maf [Anaerolineaceae bacterium]|nr:septum formation protein Maf [Anaerolineaceae bacterium]
MQKTKIILASSSPRRKEMIAWMGISFEISPADIDERLQENESPLFHVKRLAREKAQKIALKGSANVVILAADTIVINDEHILGKPKDNRHAVEMLQALRGRVHQVATAVCIIAPGNLLLQDLCISLVKMREYGDDEIRAYVDSGDPMDKAGAYAIQNGSFNPVPHFSGCFASVMGFPFCHIERNLRKIDGYNCLPVAEICQRNLHYACPIFSRVLNGEDIG